MKILIVYKSILGATKRYAVWLGEETGADIMGFSQVKPDSFDKYKVVAVASGTYAGQMPLISFLKKYWYTLAKKKVVIIAVGTIPPQDRESTMSFELIPKEIREKVTYFKLPGRMLSGTPDETLMKQKLKPVVKKLKSFAKLKQ
jgi:menaquinone-dependent protoporphyrinogen IX oxidase